MHQSIQENNISNVIDSILKDYGKIETTKVEGLPDFENIPHKVSMAAVGNEDE